LLAQARSSGEYISTLQRGEGGDDKVCVFDNRLLFHKHRSEKTGCNKVEISKRTNVFHKKLAGRHLCVSLLGSRLFWVSVFLSRQWLLLLDSLTATAAPCWSGLTIVSLRLSLTLSLSLYPSLSLSLSLTQVPCPLSLSTRPWAMYMTPRVFEGSLVRFLKTVLKTVNTSRAFPENRATN